MSMSIWSFSEYAAANVSDNQRVVLSGDHVKSGAADAGLHGRKVSVSDAGITQSQENNLVRQQFLDAVLRECDAKSFKDLPECVRKAFKVGALKDDMQLNAEGKVTSGRPLTARRIKAVLAAVRSAGASGPAKPSEFQSEGRKLEFVGIGRFSSYQLSDDKNFNNMPFGSQSWAYSSVAKPQTVPNFCKMLADVASHLSREPQDAEKCNVKKGGFMVRLTELTRSYGSMTEAERKTAMSKLMTMEHHETTGALIEPLQCKLRTGNRGEKVGWTEEGLADTKAQLEESMKDVVSQWQADNDGKLSLEAKIAQDMMSYMVDNWFNAE